MLLKTAVRSDVGSHVEAFLAGCQVLVLLLPVGTARPGLPPTLDVGLQLLSPRSHRPDQMPRAAWPRPVPSWDRAHPAVDLRSAQR